MRRVFSFLIMTLLGQFMFSQKPLATENLQEFHTFIKDLKSNFIYYHNKKEVISCIENTYYQHIDTISKPYYKVLFYENLLNELYDSHVILNTNTDVSYRLNSPIYIEARENRFYIKNVFSSQLDHTFSSNIIGAELVSFNQLEFQLVIDQFPTTCHDKTDPKVKEWLANKVLAGKRNEPRMIELKLPNGQLMIINMDDINQINNASLLDYSSKENVGIIRINNSLGNSDLVGVFDNALTALRNTEALIIDLRNTPDGGNTGVAEPILGRFISEKKCIRFVKIAMKHTAGM